MDNYLVVMELLHFILAAFWCLAASQSSGYTGQGRISLVSLNICFGYFSPPDCATCCDLWWVTSGLLSEQNVCFLLLTAPRPSPADRCS